MEKNNMLKPQNNYDFKSELLVVHQSDIRDYSLIKEKDEFEFFNGIKIFVKQNKIKKYVSNYY